MNIIRVIDFETSDLEPPEAQVIEVGTCDLFRDGGEWTVGEPRAYLCGGVTFIAPKARAAHHLSVGDVAASPIFAASRLQQEAASDGVQIFAAHNAEFETKFAALVPMLCTYKAALRVWPPAPGHSNSVLRYWLEDEGIISVDPVLSMPPHRAGPDAYVTACILKGLLKYTSAKQMVAWTKEPRLLPTCPIGKFRGKPWGEVEAGFLQWMLKQQDMEADLKWNASQEIKRRESFK